MFSSTLLYEQRAKFDTEREEREKAQEQENRERQALAAVEEAKKVAQLRRGVVHKALPICRYIPQHSDGSGRRSEGEGGKGRE